MTGASVVEITWIGVDWGTSNLRVFAVNHDGKVVAENQSDSGMGTLGPTEFEPALLALIEPWLHNERVTPVFACGMVGARQGWQEAEYRTVPCSPVSDTGLTVAPGKDKRITVHILPGLCQSHPSDVMRGEETQLAGLLERKPAFQGSACLPGTHSKWVSIKDGQVFSFNTFMTGELFSLLSQQSVLRHSVTCDEWDDVAFLESALTACAAPATTMADFFGLRASTLLHETPAATSRSILSGMLVGYELGLTRDYWQNRDVVLIGAPAMASLYKDALQALDTSNVDTMDAAEATVAGLTHTANIFQRT